MVRSVSDITERWAEAGTCQRSTAPVRQEVLLRVGFVGGSSVAYPAFMRNALAGDLRVVGMTILVVALVVVLLLLAFGAPVLAPNAQHTQTGLASPTL